LLSHAVRFARPEVTAIVGMAGLAPVIHWMFSYSSRLGRACAIGAFGFLDVNPGLFLSKLTHYRAGVALTSRA
jgi:hypothetical protein